MSPVPVARRDGHVYLRKDGKLPYEDTIVAVNKTRSEIDDMLWKNGAVGVQWTTFKDDRGRDQVELRWAKKIQTPDGPMVLPMKHVIRQTVRNPRAVYRALYQHLKDVFVSVEYGLMTFEEAMLPFVLQKLPEGEMTVAEMALPHIRQGQPALNLGGLVPRLGAGEVLDPEGG